MAFPRRTPGASRVRSLCTGLAGAVLGAVAARTAFTRATRAPRGDTVDDVFLDSGPSRDLWTRTNFRGEKVTLLEGPALAAGTCAAAALAPGVPRRLRAATVTAAAGAAGFGAYDDISGSAGSRGFKGHLGALARGEVTTGAVKVAGIGVTGLLAGAMIDRRPFDALVNGALIAGSANLLNLFDLRPGRAAKVGLAVGVPALAGPGAGAAGPVLGATAALLPEDLGERAMMGDAGANALGAVLGVAAAASLPRSARVGLLGAVAGLTLASEFVSFSKVIDATPPLRALDLAGRRPAPTPAPAPAPEEEEAAARAVGDVPWAPGTEAITVPAQQSLRTTRRTDTGGPDRP
ncbi:hypothetical protein HNR23_001173 [Nocardiopsis mwathae]|uniref:Uncharacterized protein n=1 Tax=Nocardiopsis mwathae TaxID=1472723 RepID=A0A7W9YF99_9ACTN|nr:hypothetical protein [Nocardiopsis mwathae]MBB6171113.1 hypothetical protein [Nocardiopsis mwathae]